MITVVLHWAIGFGQGFRRSVFAVAAILGPLWVGGSFRISWYLLFGVPLGLLVVLMVRFVFFLVAVMCIMWMLVMINFTAALFIHACKYS